MKNSERLLPVLVIALVGCSSTPVALVKSPRSVLMGNVAFSNMVEAHQIAEAECQKYGRHAVSDRNPSNGKQQYECKDP